MKKVQEYIEQAINQAAPKCSPEERKQYRTLLTSMCSGQVSLGEEFGVTYKMLMVLHAHANRLYSNGQYKNACAAFILLSTLCPDEPDYLFSVGACHHMLQNYHDAILAYKSSFYIDRKPFPLFHIADCYIKLNDLDSAVIYLELTKSLAGDDPEFAALKERAQMIEENLFMEQITEATKGKKGKK